MREQREVMDEAWQAILQRDKNAHKYDFGHVLVIGGSAGMEGAPMLAAEAALRVGAGLVTIASTAEVIRQIAGQIEEVMTLAALDDDSTASCQRLYDFIQQRSVSVVVIGPGMGKSQYEFIRKFLKDVQIPVVVDGGALRALSDHEHAMSEVTKQNNQYVLTPHTGEFADLIKKQSVTKADAKDFVKTYDITLVLKGNPTFVATKDSLYENTSNTPALATAGTGDVLAGMIAGVIGQGQGVATATKMAVYVHGMAGELAAKEKTEAGVTAGDVIESIPAAMRQVETT